jgi:benzoyl-CoA 2,3-epoxidase subunit A
MGAAVTIEQHVIDPEICIRCNTCEATCPVGAVTHDERNYVVDADKCNFCMACVPPCPTGSIDNWRTVLKAKAYTVAEQFSWDELPAPLALEVLADSNPAPISSPVAIDSKASQTSITAGAQVQAPSTIEASYGSTNPPWSAAHPYVNLYGPKIATPFVVARVTGNVRVTEVGTDYDTHHIVLDFGQQLFPVLEGQSIGVLPPGLDASGRSHHARQYSVASARDGERAGYNNVSLTVKRVLEDHSGKPVRGVASNFLCDLNVGDTVNVIGPFGTSFLMPNHEQTHLVMICTGTGSAPMRAMTEWRRRQVALDAKLGKSRFANSKLKLYFGARTREELPYFGPLQSLPKGFIDIHFAFSRAADQPKRYVQDLMLADAASLLPLIEDPQAYFYVCGLKAMEQGVVDTLKTICQDAGRDWSQVATQLKAQGRLHLETY